MLFAWDDSRRRRWTIPSPSFFSLHVARFPVGIRAYVILSFGCKFLRNVMYARESRDRKECHARLTFICHVPFYDYAESVPDSLRRALFCFHHIIVLLRGPISRWFFFTSLYIYHWISKWGFINAKRILLEFLHFLFFFSCYLYIEKY